jgi:hypothetical protein
MQPHEELIATIPDTLLLDLRTQREGVEVCFEAEVACVVCADACLGEDDIAELRRCIRCCLDTADVAGATARMLARRLDDARLLRAQVEACARALAACAAECHLQARHEHCRACELACHQAAESCGAVLRQLPDAHGLTHPKKTPSAE